VLGFGLGLVILLGLDRVDDRMASLAEVEELFDEDVLGQIPRQSAGTSWAALFPPCSRMTSGIRLWKPTAICVPRCYT